MTASRASTEGLPGLNRSQTYGLEASHTTPSGLYSSTVSDSTTPIYRKRSSKSKSRPEDPAPSASLTWPDVDKAEPRKNRLGRATPHKTSRDASPRTSTSPKTSTSELELRDKEIAGYLPKLSRILEGKENAPQRHRKSSSASSQDIETFPRRSRAAEDASIAARRVARQRQTILARRADSFSNLPNPSTLSLVSGLTNSSNTSSGSNSTVTQKSYDRSNVSKRRQTKERRRIETKKASAKSKDMDTPTAESSVFQYMHEDLASAQLRSTERPHSSSSSSSSSSASTASTALSGSNEGGDASSNADEPEVESPMTSPPTSSKKLVQDEAAPRERFNNDSGISVRENSPDADEHVRPRQPSVSDPEDEEEDEDEDDEEAEDEDEEESDDDSDEEGHGVSHAYAMQRVPPPVAPSASPSASPSPSHPQRAGSHDRHHRRLRDQEEELRQHVLQNPQPHHNFQFFGDPSPRPQPALPLIDPNAQYEAASTAMYSQAPPASAWPQATRPPSIAYYPPPQAPHPPTHAHTDNTYPPSPGGSSLLAPPPFYFPHAQPPHYQPYAPGPDLTKTTMVGYELLADKLSERPKDNEVEDTRVMPMYRKFEYLNHRVLLHLQDEISELEEELRYVDECIAQMSPVAEEGHAIPASRRAEARYGGELHYRRTDCLGRIYMKLGQYNQALSSYSTMMKDLDPASAEDIQTYHSWMQRHAPVDKAESRFLEHKGDLLAMARRRRSSGVVGGAGPGPVESAALGLPLVLVLLVLPLMAFAVIPGLLGRLFTTLIIGLAQVAVVLQTDFVGVMSVREWATCGSIYFAFLAVLAGVAQ